MSLNKKTSSKVHATETGIPTHKSKSKDKTGQKTKLATASSSNSNLAEVEAMEITPINLKRTREHSSAEDLALERKRNKDLVPGPEIPSKGKLNELEQPGSKSNVAPNVDLVAETAICVGTISQALLKLKRENSTEAFESLNRLSEMIHRLSNKCNRLEGALEESRRQKPAEVRQSYASVAQKLVLPKTKAKEATIRTPQKVLFVRAKDELKLASADATKAELMKTFNPQKEKVQIKNIRKTKLGLVVETATEEDLQKLEKNASISSKFVLERPQKRRPRVIIYDVPRDVKEEELSMAVFEQNNALASSASDLAVNFKPKFRTGKKDSETTNWVVEVGPDVRKVLLNARKLFIGWRACKVQDYLLVARCFKCQGFGHIAKHCDREEVCSHCADSGHKSADCTKKSHGKKCANCLRMKRDAGHDTTDKQCPLYKTALERQINSTDYGL